MICPKGRCLGTAIFFLTHSFAFLFPSLGANRKLGHPGSWALPFYSALPPNLSVHTLLPGGGGVLGWVWWCPWTHSFQQQAALFQKPVAEEYRWCLLPCGQPKCSHARETVGVIKTISFLRQWKQTEQQSQSGHRRTSREHTDWRNCKMA